MAVVRPESADRYFSLGITKVEEQSDGSVLVHGRPTQEVLDIDKQIADKEWFKQALPEWWRWKNIREMHAGSAVGVGKELQWDENEDPFLVAKIVDPVAALKCREGVYKGFSIGVKDPEIRHDPDAANGRIVGGKIVEVSVVDYPAVPTAKIEVMKAVGPGAWLNCQSGAIIEKTINPINPDPSLSDSTMLDFHDDRIETGDVTGQVVEVDTSGHRVIVRVGDQLWEVPFEYEASSGELTYGTARPLPREDSESTKGAKVEAVAVARGKPGGSFEDLQDRLRAAIDPPDPVTGNRNYDVSLVATYPDCCVVSRWDEGKYFRVPYEVKDGDIVLGKPEQVEQSFVPVKASEKGVRAALTKAAADLGKDAWTTEYVNGLPDAAFAYVEPGADKDKSKRHLPYKDKDGKVDAAHVRNALARLDQTDIPAEAKTEARQKLESAATEVGIEVEGENKDGKAADAEEAKGADGSSPDLVYCAECGKEVPFTSDGETEGIKEIGKSGEGMEPGHCEKGHRLGKHVGKEEFAAKRKAVAEKGTRAQEAAVSEAVAALEKQIDEAKTKLEDLKAKQRTDEGGAKGAESEEGKGAMRNDVGAPEKGNIAAEGVDEADLDGKIKAAIKAALAAHGISEKAPVVKAVESLGAALRKGAGEYDALQKAGWGNDGGPTGAESPATGRGRHLVPPEFRSAVKEIAELARALEEAEAEMRPGKTSDGREDMGTARGAKPEDIDLVPGAGKGVVPDISKAVVAALAPLGPELAKSVGAQLEKAVAPLVSRLEKVEHMAVPPRHELTVAERPGSSLDGRGDPLEKAAERTRRISQIRDMQERAGGSVFNSLAVAAVAESPPLSLRP